MGTGLLVWVSYRIIGIELPFMWGVLAFFFNYIPTIGSLAVGIVSVFFAFIQFFPVWQNPAAAAGIMFGIQMIMGNYLDPKFQGDRLDMSPVVILLSLLIWGYIWGIVGMFLAVPLTASIQIVCENTPFLKPVAVLMASGRKRHRPPPGRRG